LRSDKLGKQEAETDYNLKIVPLLQVSSLIHTHPLEFIRHLQTRGDLFLPYLLPTTYSLHNYHIMGSRILSRSFHVERWEGEGGEEQISADAAHEDLPVVAEPPSDDMVVDDNDDVNLPEGVERVEDSDEEDEDDPSDVAMVPMADMLNARYESENAKLFHEATHLKMVTTKAIKAGEQIYNTYGDLPNSDLLRRYGHVDILEIPGSNALMGNPADVVEVPADLIPSVIGTNPEILKERIDWWLDEGGDDVFVLDLESPVPDVLISFSKLLLISEDDWEKGKSKGKPPKPKLDDDRTVSVILDALRKRLRDYPTSFETDEELLRTLENDNESSLILNKKNAIVVRLGEKRILNAAIAKLNLLQPELKSSSAVNNGKQERAHGSGNAKRKRESNDGKQSEKRGRL